jgi:probable F420-dependent oxidoreductase
MITTDELRRTLGPLGIWMPPPAGIGIEPESYARAVEAAGQAYVKPYTKMVQFLDDLPAVPVPVILAALGPRMLELSRDRAAGAHPYFSPPEHTALARQALGPTPLLVPEIAVALAAGDPGAAQARDYARFYLRLPNYTGNLRRLGYTDADIDGGGSDRLMSAVVPHGPTESLARIGGHLDAGADHVLVQLIGEGGRFAAGDLEALAELTTGLR